MSPIGFLFFLRRRAQFNRLYEQNRRLRERLDRYEPRRAKPAAPPASGSGVGWVILLVLVIIGVIVLANGGGA